MSDKPIKDNEENPKPKPVKRPASPRYKVLRGISWDTPEGREAARYYVNDIISGRDIPRKFIKDYLAINALTTITESEN